MSNDPNRIDIGIEIAYRLKVEQKPLTNNQIRKYLGKATQSRIDELMENVDILENCPMPIPVNVLAKLCGCEEVSIYGILDKAKAKLGKRAYERFTKTFDISIPRPNL